VCVEEAVDPEYVEAVRRTGFGDLRAGFRGLVLRRGARGQGVWLAGVREVEGWIHHGALRATCSRCPAAPVVFQSPNNDSKS
jgi:hypothetical protein